MNKSTYERLLAQLNQELLQHPHQEELLRLMQDQLHDDTLVLKPNNPCCY